MKSCLLFATTFLIFSPTFSQAYQIENPATSLAEMKKTNDSTEIYVKNNQGKSILLYKANFSYLDEEKLNVKRISNVLWVDFFCAPKKTCTRLFDQRSGKLSEIYPYLIDYDAEKAVVAIYDQEKNQITLKTAFEPCIKPALYRLVIASGTSFGPDTGFKPNGYLQSAWRPSYAYYKFLNISYIDPVAQKSVRLVIPIYHLFFSFCKTGDV